MRQKSSANYIAWRFYLIIFLIGLAITGLLARVFDLAILSQKFLRREGDSRILRLQQSPGFRGMIVDRNGFPFAVSTEIFSVWINPKEFSPDSRQLNFLSQVTQLSSRNIEKIAAAYLKKKRTFAYIKRNLPPALAKQIRQQKIAGVYLQRDFKRFYPEGEVAAHLIGRTNVDDRGQEGLELGFDGWLQGISGKKWVLKDRFGQAIDDVKTLSEQKSGNDLMLSIDRRIQYIAYRELMNGVLENKASSGSVVVLDVKSGEVLAMANYPSFNPNRQINKVSDDLRNRAVTDTFEPGSTIKAFSIATALASGKFKPDTVINTYPGWVRVGRHLVQDEHNHPSMTVTQVLQFSSNVGTTKILQSLPPDNLWNLLHKIGFGEITGISFPGERGGVLIRQSPWDPFALATLSFGYGISITPLQLACAYAVLGNDGVKLPVTLLRQDNPPTGEQIMEPKLARQMLTLLETVVTKGGTGELARVPGYHIAGKTGTARMLSEDGYSKRNHVSSFVGIAPVTNPKLVVAVVIRDPQGKHYLGGFVSGPVFEKIMEETLRTLDVPPDDEGTL